MATILSLWLILVQPDFVVLSDCVDHYIYIEPRVITDGEHTLLIQEGACVEA